MLKYTFFLLTTFGIGMLMLGIGVSVTNNNDASTSKSYYDANQAPPVSENSDQGFYTHRRLTPHFGIEAIGVNLNDPTLTENDQFVSQLRQDLARHRAILFRSQNLSGERQVNISTALGEVIRSKEHEKSPSSAITRLSNNKTEGFTNVGTTGWHIDGAMLEKPFMYQTMHFPSVSEGGHTHLMPFKELYDSFSEDEKEYYNKLWIKIGSGSSDSNGNNKKKRKKSRPVHPVVYKHPFRPNEETMLIHLGIGLGGWYLDEDKDTKRGNDTVANSMNNGVDTTNSISKRVIQDQLVNKIDSQVDTIGLRMKWQQGDFMIIDNLGNGEDSIRSIMLSMDINFNPTVIKSDAVVVGPAASSNNDEDASNKFYGRHQLTPHFGIEAVDINLEDPSLTDNDEFISQLKQDLARHRVVLFRSQNLSGERQVNISTALGQLHTSYKQHEKSPHPLIHRLSNDKEEGFTGFGTSGWHIDGVILQTPFAYQTMYLPSVCEGGDTYIVPFKEFIDTFTSEEKELYNKIWLKSSKNLRPVHPLMSKHPYRPNEETMVFHLGVGMWDVHLDANNEEALQNPNDNTTTTVVNGVNMTNSRTKRIIQEDLTRKLNTQLDTIGLRMKWQNGDFLIIDNLGVTHFASKGTQSSSKTTGLRILHRTTIVGGNETIPRKLDGRGSFWLPREPRNMNNGKKVQREKI